jgi:hypothetical protein
MKLLSTFLIILSMATQVVATLPDAAEESPRIVAEATTGYSQKSSLLRWVGTGKTVSFWVAGVSVLPASVYLVSKCIPGVSQETSNSFYKLFDDISLFPWGGGAVLGLILGGIETRLQRGENLSHPVLYPIQMEKRIFERGIMTLDRRLKKPSVSHDMGGFSSLVVSQIPSLKNPLFHLDWVYHRKRWSRCRH